MMKVAIFALGDKKVVLVSYENMGLCIFMMHVLCPEIKLKNYASNIFLLKYLPLNYGPLNYYH